LKYFAIVSAFPQAFGYIINYVEHEYDCHTTRNGFAIIVIRHRLGLVIELEQNCIYSNFTSSYTTYWKPL